MNATTCQQQNQMIITHIEQLRRSQHLNTSKLNKCIPNTHCKEKFSKELLSDEKELCNDEKFENNYFIWTPENKVKYEHFLKPQEKIKTSNNNFCKQEELKKRKLNEKQTVVEQHEPSKLLNLSQLNENNKKSYNKNDNSGLIHFGTMSLKNSNVDISSLFPAYNFEEVNTIFDEIPLTPLNLKLSDKDIEELCYYPAATSLYNAKRIKH
ncbi:hypothetical protein ABK040_004960 [Willaertia magna]